MTVLDLILLWDRSNTFSQRVIGEEMAITQVFGGDQNMELAEFQQCSKETERHQRDEWWLQRSNVERQSQRSQVKKKTQNLESSIYFWASKRRCNSVICTQSSIFFN